MKNAEKEGTTWLDVRRQLRQYGCKRMYERDTTVAILAWTYGWDAVIDAYMLTRKASDAFEQLWRDYVLRPGRQNESWKNRAIVRVLQHFFPQILPIKPLTHEELVEARSAPPLNENYEHRPYQHDLADDPDLMFAAPSTYITAERSSHCRDMISHETCVSADCTWDIGTGCSFLKRYSHSIHSTTIDRDTLLTLDLDPETRAQIARRLTAALVRAFECHGDETQNKLYYRGDGRDLDMDLTNVDQRAIRLRSLTNTFVSVSTDIENMDSFVNKGTKCCKFHIFGSSLFELDIRRALATLPHQRRYVEAHLNADTENERLLAPGHTFASVETADEKRACFLAHWIREADKATIPHYGATAEHSDESKYVVFGNVAFPVGKENIALPFLGHKMTALYTREWFNSALTYVYVVKASFSRRNFRQCMERDPSLVPILVKTYAPPYMDVAAPMQVD